MPRDEIIVDVTEHARRSELAETAVRALLSVALFAAFPPFSDIYRLWRRSAGIVPSDLGTGAFEYPPLGTWFTDVLSWLPSARLAVVVNGLLMAGAAVAVTMLLGTDYARRRNADIRMWVASPALLLLLPINWDVAVALFLLLAIHQLATERAGFSGALIGVGTLLKVFPGSAVLPLLALIRDPRKRGLLVGGSVGMVVLGYTLYASLLPSDWLTHLEFASQRSDFDSSIWGLVDWIMGVFGGGLSVGTVNLLATTATGLSIIGLAVWVQRAKPSLAEAAVLAVLAFILFNKIFKPQYVLWVIPLMALAGNRRRHARVFEATALVDFAVIYFAQLPALLVPFAVAVRAGAIGMAVADVVKRKRRTHT